MQFTEIKFYESRIPAKPGLCLHVRGYWVPRREFDLMWRNAQETLPIIDWSKLQTAETLFGGRERWRARPVGQRLALGRVLKYFSENDVLPIEVANPSKKGTRKYRRKK